MRSLQAKWVSWLQQDADSKQCVYLSSAAVAVNVIAAGKLQRNDELFQALVKKKKA